MKTITLIFLILLGANSFAQKNRLSFELSYGLNSFKMGNLNTFHIDSFAKKEEVELLKNNIKRGQHYQFRVSYCPIGLFDIEVYGSYQFGNSESTYDLIETDDFGFPVRIHPSNYNLKTEALGAGITTSWYISHLLKFHEKENTLNRLHLGIELNGGIGFSKVVADIRVPSLPMASVYEFFESKDFQGQVGLKIEYDLTKNPLYTTLGIRFGYQFFRTKTVRDRYNNEWVVLEQHPINLDFSGIYGALYIKIGK